MMVIPADQQDVGGLNLAHNHALPSMKAACEDERFIITREKNTNKAGMRQPSNN